MTDAQVAASAYPTEWSVAQVMSHLGSGAEIFRAYLTAGLEGTPAPGAEVFEPVWAEWNDKSPPEQAHDGIRADARFVEFVDGFDEAQRETWRLEMFGGEQGLTDVLGFRLNEHALHTWDIAVALDPSATLLPEAAELVVTRLELVARYTGKPPSSPVEVEVTTDNPSGSFQLRATADGVSLTAMADGPIATGATLRLPAEALIRLVYGRLDAEHTPPLEIDGVDLDTLRQIFPGP
jgi:uncharacterized protein (TIGR03083 family)